jgi:hypothetical protein
LEDAEDPNLTTVNRACELSKQMPQALQEALVTLKQISGLRMPGRSLKRFLRKI